MKRPKDVNAARAKLDAGKGTLNFGKPPRKPKRGGVTAVEGRPLFRFGQEVAVPEPEPAWVDPRGEVEQGRPANENRPPVPSGNSLVRGALLRNTGLLALVLSLTPSRLGNGELDVRDLENVAPNDASRRYPPMTDFEANGFGYEVEVTANTLPDTPPASVAIDRPETVFVPASDPLPEGQFYSGYFGDLPAAPVPAPTGNAVSPAATVAPEPTASPRTRPLERTPNVPIPEATLEVSVKGGRVYVTVRGESPAQASGAKPKRPREKRPSKMENQTVYYRMVRGFLDFVGDADEYRQMLSALVWNVYHVNDDGEIVLSAPGQSALDVLKSLGRGEAKLDFFGFLWDHATGQLLDDVQGRLMSAPDELLRKGGYRGMSLQQAWGQARRLGWTYGEGDIYAQSTLRWLQETLGEPDRERQIRVRSLFAGG